MVGLTRLVVICFATNIVTGNLNHIWVLFSPTCNTVQLWIIPEYQILHHCLRWRYWFLGCLLGNWELMKFRQTWRCLEVTWVFAQPTGRAPESLWRRSVKRVGGVEWTLAPKYPSLDGNHIWSQQLPSVDIWARDPGFFLSVPSREAWARPVPPSEQNWRVAAGEWWPYSLSLSIKSKHMQY